MLEDYNGHTHWLSAPTRWLVAFDGIPSELNIAIGYSANGMFGEFENRGGVLSASELTFLTSRRSWGSIPPAHLLQTLTRAMDTRPINRHICPRCHIQAK